MTSNYCKNTLNKISLLVPTRGRIGFAERFGNSVVKMADNISACELIFYVDDDDVKSHKLKIDGVYYKIIIGPRTTMGDCNSKCFEASSGEIIVLANDDVIIKTKGWDTKFREVDNLFKDKIYLAYPNDLNKGRKLAAFPVLSRSTCKLLQEPFPKIYQGALIDLHLMDIFNRLKFSGFDRIKYLPGVIFEHLHFRTGKSIVDQTYLQRDRFGDDMNYVCLLNKRKYLSKKLEFLISNNTYDTLFEPDFQPDVLLTKKHNLFYIIKVFFNCFYLDKGLPFLSRIRNFIYFTARLIVQKI